MAMAEIDLGSGYSAFDAPLGAPAELRIDLRGRVKDRCDVKAPALHLNRLDVGRAGQVKGDFDIDCNTPFVLRVRSESGGMITKFDVPGVEQKAPYEVSVQLGTSEGRTDLGWCQAASLALQASGGCSFSGSGTAEGGWSSGDAIAIRQSGQVNLRWRAPASDQARAGYYSDTLTIEIAVRS